MFWLTNFNEMYTISWVYFTSRTEFVSFGVRRTPGEDLFEDDSSCVDVSLLGARLP